MLGHGFEIPVDTNLAQRLTRAGITAGTEFQSNGQLVLALDELPRQLIEPLTAYCGLGALDDVDSVLAAILWLHLKRPIVQFSIRASGRI